MKPGFCGFNDPDHSYAGGRIEVDKGLMNGFMETSTADVYAIGYYQVVDNQFLSQFARNFTTCDMYFPSILAPTFPNRIFQICGQNLGEETSKGMTKNARAGIYPSYAPVGYRNVPRTGRWWKRPRGKGARCRQRCSNRLKSCAIRTGKVIDRKRTKRGSGRDSEIWLLR